MEYLKYIIFFSGAIVGVPSVLVFLLFFPKRAGWVFGTMLWSTCLGSRIAINFFSHETYRGTSRGMEVSLADLFALSMLIFMYMSKRYRVSLWPKGVLWYLLYFIAAVLSMVNAESRLFSFLELWKMLKMWLMFIVVYNYVLNTRDIEPMMIAFGIVAIHSFVLILWQKYILHIYQPDGLFPHQNSMSMYMGMIGTIFFLRWIHGTGSRLSRWFNLLSFICASAGAILSFSRGAIMCYPISCILALAISLIHGWNYKQMLKILTLCSVCILAVGYLVPSIFLRFLYAPKSSGQTRVNFAIAAVNMANDKTLGVGINNWGIKINPPYTYAKHREEMRMRPDFKDGLVETIYLMVAAECGWWALGVLLIWFISYYVLCVRNLVYCFRTEWFSLLAGIICGLTMVYMQSTLEWVLKQSVNFYQLMTLYAVTAAVYKMSKKKKEKRKPRAMVPAIQEGLRSEI